MELSASVISHNAQKINITLVSPRKKDSKIKYLATQKKHIDCICMCSKYVCDLVEKDANEKEYNDALEMFNFTLLRLDKFYENNKEYI